MRNLLLSAKYRLRGAFRSIKHSANSKILFRRKKVNSNYVDLLSRLEACCGPITGKNLLEIGCDPKGEFLQYLTSQRHMAEAIGINIGLTTIARTENFTLLKEDVRSLPFRDDSFDLISSISTFEHIHDFDAALAEMYRVLKPGGYLFSEFTPIWSGVWGHHLWLYHGGEVRSWVNTPLPPYAHLVMNEENLHAWVIEKYRDEALCEKILDYVYRSEEQNRLFYSDFEQAINKSDFKTIFFVGFADLPLQKGYEVDDLDVVMDVLRSKYPDKSGFGYHGISLLLSKSNE